MGSLRIALRSRSTAPAAAALLLALLACLAVGSARAEAVPPAEAAPPHLLLIHGGSFLYEDPEFQLSTEAAAVAAGFVPHYLEYPLGDLPAAVLRARAEARELRRRVGLERVYAYGSSAGGTLAALLAGDGLVAAAAVKAPISDLLGWQWPLAAYGPDYHERIGADAAALRRLSPLRRPARSPVLVVQGAGDGVVPASMNETYAAKFRRVHLRVVPGGHRTERARPWVLGAAMRWLGTVAAANRAASQAKQKTPRSEDSPA